MGFPIRNALSASLAFLMTVPALAAPDVRFTRACDTADQTLTIAAVGDILPHTSLALQAYSQKSGFLSLWHKITPQLQAADIAVANLEGPTAEGVAKRGKLMDDPGPRYDGEVYTGTDFVFNYHPRIIDDMAAGGFDIVTLSNNHTFDRMAIGVDRTIDAFRKRGFPYIGVKRSNEQKAPWFTVMKRNGFRVAFISCTEATNGWPDKYHQTLNCVKDADTITAQIERLVRSPKIDAVFVLPHWGTEYQLKPNTRQVTLARRYLEAGATAIFGSHPHVQQPMEKYVTRDGRETFIIYSLGNFVSAQGKFVAQKTTAVVYLGLSRRNGQKPWVNGVSYLPLTVDRRPWTIELLEKSKQANRSDAYKIVRSLFDPSRELKANQRIRTNLECF